MAVAIAGLVRWLFDPFLGDHLPFVTFFVGVAAAAWVGGLRPALLATWLGFGVAWFLFVPPRHSWDLPSGPHLFGLGAYFIVCLALTAFGEAMHIARRRTEQEQLKTLAERERFRLAAQAVNGIIYEYDLATGHVERQRGLYEVVGYRADEVPPTAAWWWEQIHPDDHESLQKRFVELAGNSSVGEYRVRHKDGRWLHVEDRAVLLRGDDGQLRKMIGCTVDVTAPKQADAELQRRDTFISGILGSITDWFGVVCKDWRFTFANDELVRRFGKPRDEILGNAMWEMFPDAVGNHAYVQLHRAMAERVAVEYEVYYEPWQRWFLDKAFPTADGGLAVYTRDITDRKRVQDDLRRSEGRFRAGINAVSDIVWTNDAQGQMAGEQAAWGNFTGQDQESYQGYGWSRAVHPDDAQPTIDAWNEAVAGKKNFAFEHRVRRSDGQWRLCSVRAVPVMDDRGEITEWVGVHTDITERKEAEQRVRASEARLRRVFESNVVGMIRWDLDRSLILDANDEFLRMTGYVRDDVTSGRLNFRELTPPEWTARNEEGIRAIRADGHAPPYEKEYFRKDGSRLPLIIAGTRFEDSPSEGISFLIDLSEIKRVEAALLASAQRHSYLVKLADTLRPLSDPMQVQSKASRVLGEYLVASRVVYFEIQGDDYVVERDYTAGVMPLQGRYPTKSFGPGLFADFLAGRIVSATDIKADATRPQAERDAFAAIQIDAHVTVPLVKDGVFVAGLAVHSSSPRTWTPTEIAIIEDTAQRTWASVQQARAAAALRDSEERFRTLFQTMDEGFCLAEVDLDGDGRATDYRIVEANPAFEKHTGLRGVLGQSIRRTIPGLEEFWFKAYRRLAETGEAIRFVHQAKPLSERWFDVSAFRLGGDGSQRVAILFNDISARKQGEEERERLVGQLRDADRHKDEFLATLAHELRNPLAPIRNGLQIMKLPHVDAGTVEKSRSMMERQVEQMTRLIDDLMDVSRINQGKIQLQKTRMPLADAVRNAVDTSRPLIDVQGHELVVDMPPQPIYVDGDLTRLSQVFANLLNNSAKYTDRGGRIRLAVERQGSDAVVSIADNGAGIPADMLVRVFDMFAQIDGSLEKSQGGLGIGLNIVKRLVEMHDGSITAESGGPGMGSTFNVRLPVALSVTEKRPDDQSTDEKATPTPRRRILVVDDNRDGASSLEMLLEIMGHETQTAHDGLEAVAMSEAFKPDVILMDIGMPKLNGYDACRRIREQPWAEGIVLVAMTGWGQEEDRQKSKDSGFNGHLVKPVEHVALMKLLANS